MIMHLNKNNYSRYLDKIHACVIRNFCSWNCFPNYYLLDFIFALLSLMSVILVLTLID